MRIPLLFLMAALLLLPACAGRRDGRWTEFPPDAAHVYRELESVALEVHVFDPPGKRLPARAAVLFFHGGSWTRGGPQRFFPHARELASRGMVALSASYRLEGTHGTGVAEALDDAKAAYGWVVAHAQELGIDPDRIVVAGGSAGGQLAAGIALLDPLPSTPPAALVLYNPALNTDPDDFEGLLGWAARPRLERLFAGRYAELSPTRHVRAGTPPSALFHGTGDSIVPVEQSRDFCDRLAAVETRCDLFEYPGAQHGSFNFGWGRHYEDAVLKTARFLGEIGLLQLEVR